MVGGQCLSGFSSIDEDISVCFPTVITGKKGEQSVLPEDWEGVLLEVTHVTSALLLLTCHLPINVPSGPPRAWKGEQPEMFCGQEE